MPEPIELDVQKYSKSFMQMTGYAHVFVCSKIDQIISVFIAFEIRK